MNINEWSKQAEADLKAVGITTARLDALVLLEDTLNTNRTQILAHPEREITEANNTILNIALRKRARHIPLAYIRNKSEFYGREFYVDEHVLVPRPESEAMIDMLKSLKRSKPRIADVGSGSGALGITAKLEIPDAEVTLLEIDSKALAVSHKNAQQHNADVQCLQSDLLKDTTEHFDALLCNLPYVPDEYPVNRAASHEPRLALYGGTDGLDLYRELLDQLRDRPRPKYILTESLTGQHDDLHKLAATHGYELMRTEGLIQLYTMSPDVPSS